MRKISIKSGRMDLRTAGKTLRRISKKFFCLCWKTADNRKASELVIDHKISYSCVDELAKDRLCSCFNSHVQDVNALLDECILSLRECFPEQDTNDSFKEPDRVCLMHLRGLSLNESEMKLETQNPTKPLEKQIKEFDLNQKTCDVIKNQKSANSENSNSVRLLSMTRSPLQKIGRDQSTTKPPSTKISYSRVKEWVCRTAVSRFRSRKCRQRVGDSSDTTSPACTNKNYFLQDDQDAILDNLYNEMIENIQRNGIQL